MMGDHPIPPRGMSGKGATIPITASLKELTIPFVEQQVEQDEVYKTMYCVIKVMNTSR
jgi:hypothetical protein